MPAQTQPVGPTGQPPTADAQSPFDFANQARAAQHSRADDSPVDVNSEAIIGRSQALTTDVVGKDFASAMAVRQHLANKMLTE